MAGRFHLVGRIAVDVETRRRRRGRALRPGRARRTSGRRYARAVAFHARSLRPAGLGPVASGRGPALDRRLRARRCPARAGALPDGARRMCSAIRSAPSSRTHLAAREAQSRAQPGAVRPAAGAARRGAAVVEGPRREGARRGRWPACRQSPMRCAGRDLGETRGASRRAVVVWCARSLMRQDARRLRAHLRRAG